VLDDVLLDGDNRAVLEDGHGLDFLKGQFLRFGRWSLPRIGRQTIQKTLEDGLGNPLRGTWTSGGAADSGYADAWPC
jgi:hypothetical protein